MGIAGTGARKLCTRSCLAVLEVTLRRIGRSLHEVEYIHMDSNSVSNMGGNTNGVSGDLSLKCVRCGEKATGNHVIALERTTDVTKMRWHYYLCPKCWGEMRERCEERWC